MFTLGVKKVVIVMTTTILLGSIGFSQDASAHSDKMIGLPNPIVTYDTYGAAAKIADFKPLYLPKASGYDCDYISLIDKSLSDLRFKKQDDSNASIRVRTARRDKHEGENISGIYSVTWNDRTIDGITVSVAEIKSDSYAASWKQGNYLFSAQCEGMDYSEFLHILKDGLVDMSVHYY